MTHPLIPLRQPPRKFGVKRPRVKLPSLAVILLPALCLMLLVLTPLSPTTLLPHAPPTHQISDHALASTARRARAQPPCATPASRARSFLMVFMGHSGSTAIISELRAHSQVLIETAELVDHQPVFNTSAALATIRAFFKRGIDQGLTPGFKIRPAHILNEPQLFRSLVAEFDTRIIWQYRQNVFKAGVGEYATRYLNDSRGVEGLKTNQTREERCNHAAGCSFKIDDFGFLHDMLRQKVRSHHSILSAVRALVDGANGCVREVPYEDYLYDRAAVMRDLELFLGLEFEDTHPKRFKANGDSLCEVVENWKEVCTQFYGCLAWQSMMDDAVNECFCDYTTGSVKYCSPQF